MIAIAAILGVLILCAIAVVFWFIRGTGQQELKDAGIYIDDAQPWPFPVAMPQHDVKPKRKPALKKATTVAKKKTAVKKPVAIKAKPKTKK